MQIISDSVGVALKPYGVKIGWRELMNYAAAVGDDNPIYFDDEREEGIVAHPLFCVAVTWPICAGLGRYLDTDRFPAELWVTQVHFSEHLEFHRLIRPGDSLTVGGRIAAILPHRSGARFILRLDCMDGSGQPVFTEHIGALLRGVTCVDSGQGNENLPPEPPAPADGAAGWQQTLSIPNLLPYVYDGCANIHFPIHTSRKFARQVGLPGIIVQGTATLALVVRELVNLEAGGDPEALRTLACRFTGMVRPGDRIRIEQTGSSPLNNGRRIYFEAAQESSGKAVLHGCAGLLSIDDPR